jgi:hypothetical protein
MIILKRHINFNMTPCVVAFRIIEYIDQTRSLLYLRIDAFFSLFFGPEDGSSRATFLRYVRNVVSDYTASHAPPLFMITATRTTYPVKPIVAGKH